LSATRRSKVDRPSSQITNTSPAAGLVSQLSYTYNKANQRLLQQEADNTVSLWTYDRKYQLANELRYTIGSGSVPGWSTLTVDQWAALTVDQWAALPLDSLPPDGGTTVFSITHTYDPAGNRVQENDGTTITTYTYTPANRLTLANANGAVTTYTNDLAGNRTAMLPPSSDNTYYSWDAAGRMVMAEPTAGIMTLTYNADGQRTAKQSTDASVMGFLYDYKKLLHETDDVGGEITNTYATTSDGEFGDLISEDGDQYFHQFDAQASTNALLDATGAVEAQFKYYAFGEISAVNIAGEGWVTITPEEWEGLSLDLKTSMNYTGQKQYYLDLETQFFLLGTGSDGRYYDPSVARFIAEDPIRQAGGNPDLFLYVDNNPINQIDPSGHRSADTDARSKQQKQQTTPSPNASHPGGSAPSDTGVSSGGKSPDKPGQVDQSAAGGAGHDKHPGGKSPSQPTGQVVVPSSMVDGRTLYESRTFNHKSYFIFDGKAYEKDYVKVPAKAKSSIFDASPTPEGQGRVDDAVNGASVKVSGAVLEREEGLSSGSPELVYAVPGKYSGEATNFFNGNKPGAGHDDAPSHPANEDPSARTEKSDPPKPGGASTPSPAAEPGKPTKHPKSSGTTSGPSNKGEKGTGLKPGAGHVPSPSDGTGTGTGHGAGTGGQGHQNQGQGPSGRGGGAPGSGNGQAPGTVPGTRMPSGSGMAPPGGAPAAAGQPGVPAAPGQQGEPGPGNQGQGQAGVSTQGHGQGEGSANGQDQGYGYKDGFNLPTWARVALTVALFVVVTVLFVVAFALIAVVAAAAVASALVAVGVAEATAATVAAIVVKSVMAAVLVYTASKEGKKRWDAAKGQSTGAKLGQAAAGAILDTTGITAISKGFINGKPGTGFDPVTLSDVPQSEEEKWENRIIGPMQLALSILPFIKLGGSPAPEMGASGEQLPLFEGIEPASGKGPGEQLTFWPEGDAAPAPAATPSETGPTLFDKPGPEQLELPFPKGQQLPLFKGIDPASGTGPGEQLTLWPEGDAGPTSGATPAETGPSLFDRPGSEQPELPLSTPAGNSPSQAPMSRRGDQTAFARKAEVIVSKHTEVPRNLQGQGQQTIPGSGPGGERVPDLRVRGAQGSVRLRGSVVEVKASTGRNFGDLPARGRQQIRDAVEYVRRLQNKSSLVHDPKIRSLLQKARVEVFSDLPAPVRGFFANLIRSGMIDWKPIPR
jgi:RHS repeat-associated protein